MHGHALLRHVGPHLPLAMGAGKGPAGHIVGRRMVHCPPKLRTFAA